MCGRYELSSHPAAIALAFGLPHPPGIQPRYNIAPTQQVPIVRESARGERELVQVRWGLVPRFARDPSIGVRMINARAETIHDRMPVILASNDYARWLDCSDVAAAGLLVAWRGELHVHPVSTRVNAVANDDASLCEPVAADESRDEAPDDVDAPEQLPLL